jgi:hypothetical protein
MAPGVHRVLACAPDAASHHGAGHTVRWPRPHYMQRVSDRKLATDRTRRSTDAPKPTQWRPLRAGLPDLPYALASTLGRLISCCCTRGRNHSPHAFCKSPGQVYVWVDGVPPVPGLTVMFSGLGQATPGNAVLCSSTFCGSLHAAAWMHARCGAARDQPTSAGALPRCAHP